MKRIPSIAQQAVLAALLISGPALAQEQGAGGEQPPPPAVTVVTLAAENVTLSSSLPGRVAASAEAELRPQVNGLIIERMFSEGSIVSEGDPLYRIDARSYEAAVAQAEAALAQAQATADAASREADRIAALRDRRVASEQTQDTAVAERDAALAAVQAAQATLDSARIDLDRTTITAPLDGVIGLAQASRGALVTASQETPLAVIRTIDPVQVDVTQSAAEIVRWQRQRGSQALPAGGDPTVTLQLADGTTYEHTGSLTAAEPNVDEMTGVVTLRMDFANPDGLLLPGMYVLAELPQAELRDVILAPQQGVVRDRRGRPISYVVNADNVIEERQLDIVQDHGNRWVVQDGLAPGDRLVVAGFQRIAPGATVTPEEQQETPPEGQAAPQEGAESAGAQGGTEGGAEADGAAGGEAPDNESAASGEGADSATQAPADGADAAPAAPSDAAADAPAADSNSETGNGN